ncbi:MAG: pyridoxal phosphate-dependent aminotransferase [Planctomycetia bacterium]|nr:pyridoxal phosphate-dependent aminotransferase [Planctomycetia bacterium]
MASFARHAGSLHESATMNLIGRAKAMRAAGIDVVSFGAGEPDFDTPDHVKEAAIAAIREGFTKYTPAAGIPELREAVARKFAADGLTGLPAARTIIGIGAKSVLFDAITVLTEEGDEVVVFSPYWLSYPEMVASTGARTVYVATDAAANYVIDPDRLAAAVTPRTKAIILNSPGNPTGTVQPDDVQRAIGRIAAKHGIVVISDEIYEHLAYAPARFTSFARLAPDAGDLTLLVNGTSKAYSMTGWRIGYAGGPKELIDRMIRLQGHATSGPPGICQRAALAALTGPTAPIEAMRRSFDARRRLMVDALCRIPGIACPVPDGAFYALPGVASFLGRTSPAGRPLPDVSALSEAVLEEARVAVVSGEPFGAPTSIRLSYACNEDAIRKGMERLSAFFGQVR